MTKLFEETKIKNMVLKNRLVRSATWEGMCDDSGRPTEMLINCYRNLAKGGVGLLIDQVLHIDINSEITGDIRLVVVGKKVTGIPDILAALDHRGNVVPRQLTITEDFTTVETHMGITPKQGGIVQRWDITVTKLVQRPVVTQRRDDGIHLDDAALAGFGADPAMHPVQQGATGIGDLVQMIEAHRILIANPFEWHTRDVCPQYLMTQIHHFSTWLKPPLPNP